MDAVYVEGWRNNNGKQQQQSYRQGKSFSATFVMLMMARLLRKMSEWVSPINFCTRSVLQMLWLFILEVVMRCCCLFFSSCALWWLTPASALCGSGVDRQRHQEQCIVVLHCRVIIMILNNITRALSSATTTVDMVSQHYSKGTRYIPQWTPATEWVSMWIERAYFKKLFRDPRKSIHHDKENNNTIISHRRRRGQQPKVLEWGSFRWVALSSPQFPLSPSPGSYQSLLY